VSDEPAKIGRPTLYSEALAHEICERISAGETLMEVVRHDIDGNVRERGSFPAVASIYNWADSTRPQFIPEFLEPFALAKLRQQQYWIEETVTIARNVEMGTEETAEDIIAEGAKIGVKIRTVRKDMLGHRALKIETYLKAAAKMNPQLWADRLQQPIPDHQDPNKVAPRLVIEGGLPDNDPPPPAHDAQEP